MHCSVPAVRCGGARTSQQPPGAALRQFQQPGPARQAAVCQRQRSSCPKLPACQQPTARLLLGPSQPGAPTSRLPSFLHLRARRPACTHGRQPARATRCHPRQLALTSSLLSFLYLEALMSRIALPAAGFMHLV